MTRALLFATIVASLGGLLFGFDTAVISGAEGALRRIYHDDYVRLAEWFGRPASSGAPIVEEKLPVLQRAAFWHGALVASALAGTVLGAIVFTRPADKYGRRLALAVMAAFFAVSALGSGLAWDVWSFTFFRWLGGLAIGGASVFSPLYVAEIAPARYRGRLVALVQLNVVLGILAAYLSNYVIGRLQLGEVEWRWMFGVEAAPAVLFGLLLALTPQSPRWLVGQGRIDQARKVLRAIGVDPQEAEREIEAIQEESRREQSYAAEPFFCRKYARPILLAFAIAMFNQLSGINAVIYYSRRIFEAAGASSASALLQSVIIGCTLLVATLAAMVVIDHFGRRKLMIIGSVGYIVSLAVTAWSLSTNRGGSLVLVGLLAFIASHALGQGAVIWVFIGEIFPNSVRARGVSLACFTHWVMAAVISLTFPVVAEASGASIFWFYCACMVGQLAWALFVMPETKGATLEELGARLSAH